MDIKERIKREATTMFLRYGIRSVSMDDIASHLGMSKKTIYQYYADKDELVDAVVDEDIHRIQVDCQYCSTQAENAIEEIFLTMKMVEDQIRNMNPMVIYDLQKFHYRSYQKFMEHKNKFLYDIIYQNILKGINEGLYRPDINSDVLTKFRLESLMIAFNVELFPPARYNLLDVSNEIIRHFLFGLATEKGYQLILKYQEEHVTNEK
jgi:AcrR family transcriptional regulator